MKGLAVKLAARGPMARRWLAARGPVARRWLAALLTVLVAALLACGPVHAFGAKAGSAGGSQEADSSSSASDDAGSSSSSSASDDESSSSDASDDEDSSSEALADSVVDDEVETDEAATEEAAELLGTLSSRYGLLDALVPGAAEAEAGAAASGEVVIAVGTQMLVGVNRALDGATVSFTAEAVGCALTADAGHVWVNMSGDGSTSLSVYLAEEAAAQIDSYGGWACTGTTLYVEGVYNVACSQHAGELDVHASSVSVVSEGTAVSHEVGAGEQMFAAAACGCGLLLLAVYLVLSAVVGRRRRA